MNKNYTIKKFDEIDSTNDYLQRFLYSNECNVNKEYIVIAKSQANGHGSKGRTFVSDKDKGIYFSILLHYDKQLLIDENIDINDFVTYLTPNVCVSLKRNLNNVFHKDLDIKWVNDLYYNNKKVIGILCKHYPDKNAIIIGIGIDLYKNDNLPFELKDKVGYIFDKQVDDKDLDCFITELANDINNNLYKGSIDNTYFENNLAINKKVKINDQLGKVVSINKKGHLMVEIDGAVKEIDSIDAEIIM